MKKAYIETLGCQMNKSDTEKLYGMLDFLGYVEVDEPKTAFDADLLMINTCSIRQLSEDKAFSRIGTWGKWKEQNPDLKIAFCGCVAQDKGREIFKRAHYVDLVMGTHNINEFPELLKRIENGEKICANDEIIIPEKDISQKRVKSTNAWIPITEGCDNFCTYCIVPYTRGRERSRDPKKIIEEVKQALNDGFKEVTLLGQNVDSYGKKGDFQDWNLARLLREIDKIEGKFRIRFTTSYPTDITDELIQTVVESNKICECFHIPMQSGSSVILKKMNRRYDRQQYCKIVKKIRDSVKDVAITSDFIVGFPSETEEQFEETLSVMRELELDYSNTAIYSPREGTIAAKMVDEFIEDEIKEKRLEIINNQNKENCYKSNEKYLNRELEVLIDDFSNHKGQNINTGRTRNNKIVHIPCDEDLTGKFVNVRINGFKTWYLKGELI